MSHTPRVLVYHEHAGAYREALRLRLPELPIEALAPAPPGGAAASGGQQPLPAEHGSAEALLAWKVPDGLLRSLPSLRWIQVAGAGVDHFLGRDDLAEQVRVTRSLGRFGIQVTEYVVGQLLGHLLGLERYREQQRRHLWQRHPRPLLADRTVGIVGLGSLGMPLARAVAALGARVVGVRRSGAAVAGVARVYGADVWRQMLPECDILVLTAPHTPETDRMIDAGALDALPAGAVLVNVARGALVDEDALRAALARGHLGAAILDVFASEPLPPEHPLWDEGRAHITPHVAAPSELEAMVEEFAANYARFAAGEPLRNLVDRGRGY